MSSPYMAQILMFSGNFAPKNYLMCNGQLLPINQYQALFALLGTTYGGNGTTNFGLPNMQSSVPVGWGQGLGLSFYNLGQAGGTPSVTLNQSTVPPHTHNFMAATALSATNSATVANNIPGAPPASGANFYATPPGNPPLQPQAMGAGACSTIGSNQSHTNLMPSLCITFAIAINGVFPSRN
ncbi:MAG: tail fiber protein [Xanthobacteraceae bacterium]